MPARSKMLFIIIGNDRTGKTTLQKMLVKRLCGLEYKRLDVNSSFNLSHPEIKRKYRKVSFGSRSYQEKSDVYETIGNYFANHFNAVDIAFISSHLNLAQIEAMIKNGKEQFYNVIGLFFSNSIETDRTINSQISALNWDERLVLDNPLSEDDSVIKNQLALIADNLVFFLVNRTSIS